MECGCEGHNYEFTISAPVSKKYILDDISEYIFNQYNPDVDMDMIMERCDHGDVPDCEGCEDTKEETVSQEESNKVESSLRHRINTKSTSKGIITFEVTVEGTNVPLEEVQRLHDGLHKDMVKKYPLIGQ